MVTYPRLDLETLRSMRQGRRAGIISWTWQAGRSGAGRVGVGVESALRGALRDEAAPAPPLSSEALHNPSPGPTFEGGANCSPVQTSSYSGFFLSSTFSNLLSLLISLIFIYGTLLHIHLTWSSLHLVSVIDCDSHLDLECA